ncbi:hypothetical protein WSM22_24540 [Cytophagales bacterium WSM2-2]|nr:hypothetical protein WSM22_24540 [Cytophagales bacterium WSM2-2]
MKEFRTELTPKGSSSPIGLKDKIFTIGSCFSDEIGQLLIENKFTVRKNPFGTVYNPISIHDLLLFGLNRTSPSAGSYSKNDEIHFNYYFHSSFSSLTNSDLESKVQNSITDSNLFLKNVNRIIITYGTSFVYQLRSNETVVANCHKMPSSNFEKRLLSETEIVKSFGGFYSTLKSINPSARIILTVSPVRHLKDTLELNAVSKSILRLACHSITNQFSNVEYFPAYEILLDDLRDYRFYKTDRLHPTEEAVGYIWEKFIETNVDDPARKFISEWERIKQDLAHRPLLSDSVSYFKFLNALLAKLESLQSQADVSEEVSSIRSKLKL